MDVYRLNFQSQNFVFVGSLGHPIEEGYLFHQCNSCGAYSIVDGKDASTIRGVMKRQCKPRTPNQEDACLVFQEAISPKGKGASKKLDSLIENLLSNLSN